MNLYTTKDSVYAEIETNVRAAEDSDGKPLFRKHRFSKLSFAGTLIRALANAITLFIDGPLIRLLKAIHPHTAEESELHEHLAARGMVWKAAQAARHTVCIGSSEPITADIPIGQGQIVATAGDGAVRFRLIESITVPADTVVDGRGYYTIETIVECLETGIIGNVAADAISVIESAPSGIDVVYNPDVDPVTSGAPRETINQARERIRTFDTAAGTMWLPDWYRTKAESHPNVARAIFKSSRDIGIPGAVKLWLLALSGTVTPSEQDEILAMFESDENDPGAVARVLLENFVPVSVDRIIQVQFQDAASIPAQEILDEIFDRYFAGLTEAQNYVEADIKALYLALPRTVRVLCNPPGDVIVAAGHVAVPGDYEVRGEVYVA
ncbi:MAG: phage baseplate protein [Spirochaetae bacterium HGW-Spirochaetae-10]|nr:MAG: phage baseplate protein [Spirochaetae bacterium HGW-Spirochaetae-10]